MNGLDILGKVRVKPCQFGKWVIQEFAVTESNADFHNLRCRLRGEYEQMVKAGTYLRLRDDNGVVVMSNTQMEIDTNRIVVEHAEGNVLIFGLGIGMVIEALLVKPTVTSIKVIELDEDIIEHVGLLYKDEPKIAIQQGDCLSYLPKENEHYDYIWFDIWDDINKANIQQMEELYCRFKGHCTAMNFWSIGMLTGDNNYFDHVKI